MAAAAGRGRRPRPATAQSAQGRKSRRFPNWSSTGRRKGDEQPRTPSGVTLAHDGRTSVQSKCRRIRPMPSANSGSGTSRLTIEERFAGKVEEVARMHQDAVVGQQIDDEIFFGRKRRHLHDAVPAAFGGEHLAGRHGRGERPQRPIVGRDPRLDGDPHRSSRREQFGGRRLHRRRRPRDRCRRQTPPGSSASATSRSGPPAAIHPSLACGSPIDFDSPPRLNARQSVW